MYCPRCNLHSEEYVDKCPLCAGPMEVDEFGSGILKTPTMPEKEMTGLFPQSEHVEQNEEFLREAVGANPMPGLELEQEKILEEVNKQLPDEEPGDEKKAPPLREEECLFDRKKQLYQQEIPRHSSGKKSSPLFISIGILIILILIGGGYSYFFQSDDSPLPKKLKVSLSKKERTSPRPVVSPQPPIAEQQKKSPEPIPLQPEEVKPPLVSEKTEVALPEKTAEEKPETTKPEILKQNSQEPVVSPKPPEALIVKPEPQKKEAPPVSPVPTPSGQYSVMVGAFKVEQNARDLQNKLQKKGYPVQSYLIDLPGKGSLYRVIVGNYADVKETKKVASTLKSEEKVSALIMKDGKYFQQ